MVPGPRDDRLGALGGAATGSLGGVGGGQPRVHGGDQHLGQRLDVLHHERVKVQDVTAVVARTGLPAVDPCPEVAEKALVQDRDSARAGLLLLRGPGVPIALDDFRTGHSSLAALRLLPVPERAGVAVQRPGPDAPCLGLLAGLDQAVLAQPDPTGHHELLDQTAGHARTVPVDAEAPPDWPRRGRCA